MLGPPRISAGAHEKRINAVVFHPQDSRRAVTLDSTGKRVGWNMATQDVAWSGKENFAYWSAAVSRDGLFLAAGSRGGVKIFSLATGQFIRDMNPSRGPVALSFSEDGRYIAGLIPTAVTPGTSWPEEPQLSIWNAESGKLIADVPLAGLLTASGSVTFSPDNAFVYASTTKSLAVIDVIHRKVLRRTDFNTPDNPFSLIQVSYASPLPWAIGIALSKSCNRLVLLNLETGKTRILFESDVSIDHVELSRDKSKAMIVAAGMIYEVNIAELRIEKVMAMAPFTPTKTFLPFRAPTAQVFNPVLNNVRFDLNAGILMTPGPTSGSIATWKLPAGY